MIWLTSSRMDRRALPLVDRHYSRQKPGSDRFGMPCRSVALITPDADGVWLSSWPRPEFVQHEWPDAWICSLFRNESPHLSSELIRQAVAVTRHKWGAPPSGGMVTFVAPDKVRRKRDPGRCFRRAGFVPVGWTKKEGHLVLWLSAAAMPTPKPAALPVEHHPLFA